MRISELEVVRVPIAELKPYDNNAKLHTREQIDAVEASIKEFGFRNPVIAWHNEEGVAEIVAGHARTTAAKNLGMDEVPCIFVDDLSDAQRRALTIADNQTTMMTGFDEDMLAYELDVLADEFDMADFGFSDVLDGDHGTQDDGEPARSLADRFGVPPFSILDARKGQWADRKRDWMGIGIRSELGRGAAPAGSPMPLNRNSSRLTFNIDASASAYRG